MADTATLPNPTIHIPMNRPNLHSPLFPPVTTIANGASAWLGLHGCGDSLALAEAVKADRRLYLVVTPDMQTLLRIEHELRFFLGEELPVMQFPDWETLPYDVFSPLPEIISQRIKTLAQLPSARRGVLVVTAATMAEYQDITARLFGGDDNVRRFRTSVALECLKAGLGVPLA